MFLCREIVGRERERIKIKGDILWVLLFTHVIDANNNNKPKQAQRTDTLANS